MDANVEKLIAATKESLANNTFIKLILSNYKGGDDGPQRISARIIDGKAGQTLMLQSRYQTRDVVKNFKFSEGLAQLQQDLNSGFRNAHLFTSTHDLQLTIGKRNSRLVGGRPAAKMPASRTHDREKQTLIDPAAFYLKALGISTDEGKIKAGQRDKWRQINKFVEILSGLFDSSAIKDKQMLRIVDMGSGKGYLTFAVYDHFANKRGLDVEMTGVEARAELVETCEGIARAGHFDGLSFVSGSIENFRLDEIDILVALHACDTATDDALYKGIAHNAPIIIAAPCCHKEVRRQMKAPDLLAGILKHGIMLERTAETVTDGLRSLILEREGYATKLFEFVPTEHTPKNNMVAATKRQNASRSEKARADVEKILRDFGIGSQRLEELLNNGRK